MSGSGERGSKASTPDEQELIETDKLRYSIRANVAEETEGYSEYSTRMARPSIGLSDINRPHRESYKAEQKVSSKQSFPDFSKEFFAKDDKTACEMLKQDLKHQENALKFREQTNKAMLASLLGRQTCHDDPCN